MVSSSLTAAVRTSFGYISAVEKAGFSNLIEGVKVSYEEVANRVKTSAENLRMP